MHNGQYVQTCGLWGHIQLKVFNVMYSLPLSYIILLIIIHYAVTFLLSQYSRTIKMHCLPSVYYNS
jgi:hypothetical protein